jgi:hypothetical protein
LRQGVEARLLGISIFVEAEEALRAGAVGFMAARESVLKITELPAADRATAPRPLSSIA